jgi:hypothetical protein
VNKKFKVTIEVGDGFRLNAEVEGDFNVLAAVAHVAAKYNIFLNDITCAEAYEV